MTKDRSTSLTRRWVFGAGLGAIAAGPAFGMVTRIGTNLPKPKVDTIDHLFTPAITKGNLLAQHFEKMPPHLVKPEVRFFDKTTPITFADLKGKIRLLVLSDAGPVSVQQLQEMAALQRKFGSDTFEISAIMTSVMPADIDSNPTKWAAEKHIDGMGVWVEEDMQALLINAVTADKDNPAHPGNIPTIIVVDQEGGIRGRMIGVLLPMGEHIDPRKKDHWFAYPTFWGRKEGTDLCRALSASEPAPFA